MAKAKVGSRGWLVTWAVDADPEDASSPKEAAAFAANVQNDQLANGDGGVFEVKCKATGRVWEVDLEKDEAFERGKVEVVG